MKKHLFLRIILLFCSLIGNAQNPVLIGYWQNWNDVNVPYIPLDQIDTRYDIICVSFAVPTSPSDMNMVFEPDGVSQSTLISQIQTLQAQGKKVLLSIGGANASISPDNSTSRDAFINTMNALLDTYHFDGIDIDIEHGNAILASGTIENPTSPDCINLIEAIRQIKAHYFTVNGVEMMLTFAPETAYVQGGMSAYGGIWGGYLPLLDALRNDVNYIHVQLYNSGSVFGIDGAIYNQATADFVVAMAEAVIQGFETDGGHFDGFPASKVVVGLPACPNAAGGGYLATPELESALHYLVGNGPQQGTYELMQSGGYPDFGGMMTWSINWDAVTTCNATAYEYAGTFEGVFETVLSSKPAVSRPDRNVTPNPATEQIWCGNAQPVAYQIRNLMGQVIDQGTVKPSESIAVGALEHGVYFLVVENRASSFIKQ